MSCSPPKQFIIIDKYRYNVMSNLLLVIKLKLINIVRTPQGPLELRTARARALKLSTQVRHVVFQRVMPAHEIRRDQVVLELHAIFNDLIKKKQDSPIRRSRTPT